MYLGVDGCSAGWLAVCYNGEGYVECSRYEHIRWLWDDYSAHAETILIDIPIGLREKSSKKRPCDESARQKLGRPRGSSVFPVPVREAVHAESYEQAKDIQERLTEASLGVQSWNIAEKIAQLDELLIKKEPSATNVIREAHPEVCFWALNEETATEYSKTQQPAAAFWERVEILENVDAEIMSQIRSAGSHLDASVGNDDIIDAFVLALTASPQTEVLQTLPQDESGDSERDSAGLPMEMVYAKPEE